MVEWEQGEDDGLSCRHSRCSDMVTANATIPTHQRRAGCRETASPVREGADGKGGHHQGQRAAGCRCGYAEHGRTKYIPGRIPAIPVCPLAVVIPDLVVTDPERLLTEASVLLAVLSGLLLPSWAIGTVVRLGQEAERSARQDDARQRGYEERLRIAREVHDVVGHGLAVINLQAAVALHVGGRRPEQAQVALAAIKRSSKDALEELQGTLTMFRQPDNGDGSRRPAPGLAQLEALVAAMGEGGLPVDVVVTGDRVSLPGVVDLAAYRIVQESLTN